MPFGMKNSGATLVRGMRKLLQDMDNVECYIDDLIVYTKDRATHLQVLDKLLEKLRQAGLVIRPTKCVFGSKSVEVLGHFIGENCISINKENLEKIRSAKRPTTKEKIRSFLGLANYYREHIPSFAAIAAPLSDLTKKGLPESVRWQDAQEKALWPYAKVWCVGLFCVCHITTRLLFYVPMHRTVDLGQRLCRNTKEDFFQSHTEERS